LNGGQAGGRCQKLPEPLQAHKGTAEKALTGAEILKRHDDAAHGKIMKDENIQKRQGDDQPKLPAAVFDAVGALPAKALHGAAILYHHNQSSFPLKRLALGAPGR